MKTKKAAILAGVAATALVVLTGAVAYGAGAKVTSSYPPMVSNLASKLGVSPAKVKSALEAGREEREAQREAAIKKQLDAAVKKGTITDAQRATILAKLAEIHKQRDELRAAVTDLRDWATENKVNLPALIGRPGACGPGMRGGRGAGGFGGMGGAGGGGPPDVAPGI